MPRKARTLAVSAFLASILVVQTPISAAEVVSPPSPTYTLQPLNYNREDSVAIAFGGALCDQGQCINIKHPAALGDASIQAGADNLNTMLTTDAHTSAVVAGQSQGAQSATRWMEQYAASLPEGEDVTFVLIANPSRKTGFRAQNGFATPTPEDSRFTVIDIAREYDGWADWPDHFSILAITNATMGMYGIHTKYEDVTNAPTTVEEIERAAVDDPDATENLVWKKGSTYYVVNRTEILPIATPLTWIGMPNTAKKVSDALRPPIDAAYDRPTQGEGLTPKGGDESESKTRDTTSGAPVTLTSLVEGTEGSEPTAAREVTHEDKRTDREIRKAERQAERETKREAKKAEREAKKGEREAKRAERQEAREAKKAEREAKREAKKAEQGSKKEVRGTKREPGDSDGDDT